jgi:hypothetical protein
VAPPFLEGQGYMDSEYKGFIGCVVVVALVITLFFATVKGMDDFHQRKMADKQLCWLKTPDASSMSYLPCDLYMRPKSAQ